MADIKSKEDRSLNMARIRGKDTKPEVWLRKKLYAQGYRYRKNSKVVPGHPDMWLRRYNTAVFVHGCYWHRHDGCKYAYVPKSRVDFWTAKFEQNILRDTRVKEQLEREGIRILIVWECTVKRMDKSQEEESRIMDKINQFLKESWEALLEL